MKKYYIQNISASKKLIPQLADQIHELFENDNYTLEVFIDLRKTFDTIDHAILSRKLKKHGIKGTNLAWFRGYVENRKHYIQITKEIFEILHAE